MNDFGSRKISVIDHDTHQRFYYEITNESNEPKYIGGFLLYEAGSLSGLGLDEAVPLRPICQIHLTIVAKSL